MWRILFITNFYMLRTFENRTYVPIVVLKSTFLITIPDFCFILKLMFRVSFEPSIIQSPKFRNNSIDLILSSPPVSTLKNKIETASEQDDIESVPIVRVLLKAWEIAAHSHRKDVVMPY